MPVTAWPACLSLQDRQGLDVNLLLFACYCAGKPRCLGTNAADLAAWYYRDWRDRYCAPCESCAGW